MRSAGSGRPAGPVGWLVGGGSAAVVNLVLVRAARRGMVSRPGPADLVTWLRAMLACVVAGLVAGDTVTGRPATEGGGRRAGRRGTSSSVAGLAATALALDALDGAVARRTGSVSSFGARFDGEADAFLILVMSLNAARSLGGWVASGGLARYAFGLAGCMLPWLHRPLPFRYWRKVATAVEGIALTAVATPAVPRRAAAVGAGAGLLLIAESFARDIVWLWRRREEGA